ncbi:MAG: hypothetical protein F4Z31_12160 [Gemmatimonadetes bacterium]|nr:hypothetical protein [Gemmatimonadota bacterium]MYA42495.1 hypothetical protein [Gemmatimonadota bacterium]MYE95639.1 hypothetical protein [Gemmatimonadota bacterium]MYJ09462.1 hypothetical protein [Gemmatimonadota bacterium]
MTDDEIVAAIAATVHKPYRALWQDHEDRAWQPVRQVLAHAVAAHAAALEQLTTADHSQGEYRRRTGRDVLKPIRLALRRGDLARQLHDRLAATSEDVRAAVGDLPALVRAPVASNALRGFPGLRAAERLRRFAARALRPIVWRRTDHDVAVARLARAHLASHVLPAQIRAFRSSQRDRAEWLGHMERAWSAWITAGADGSAVHEPDRVLETATTLHGELEALLDGATRASGRENGQDFGQLTHRLKATVAVAGTFAGAADAGRSGAWEHSDLASRWDEWAEQTADRLELYQRLLGATSGTRAISRRMVQGWAASAAQADGVLQTVEGELRAGLARVARLASVRAGVPDALREEQTRTSERLGEAAEALNAPSSVARDLTAAAEEAVADIEALCLQLPECLTVHGIPDPRERVRGPGRDEREVELRDAAVQAFDTLRMERIRTAPRAMVRALEEVHAQVAELLEVSSYGYEAAIAETSDADAAESEQAITLVSNGLERALDKATRAREALRSGLEAATQEAIAEVEEGADRLRRRVTADRLTAGYLDARSYVATEVARDWQRWREGVAQAGRRVAAGLRNLGRLLRPLASTLGIRPPPPGATDLREHTLASAAEFARTLPVVYRRLFAFEPLTDPRLLAGRTDALAEVAASWERWRDGGPGCQVVVSPPGAGITSFLNVAAAALAEDEPRVVRKILQTRIHTESELAATLGNWLGLAGTDDLDLLAERILEAPAGATPGVVILESAEHLHLRVRGGIRLFERLLGVMTRTEARIFWVVSLSSPAWQLVRKRAPDYLADVKRLSLSPLTADQLRKAILARHLRSGLPLQYAEPTRRGEAIRTRAQRIGRSDKQQLLIERNYFDRLHRASHGSIRLALFHWLRSADFQSLEGSLLVQPLEPLSPQLEMLDLTQSFALKAILDHGTLTVEEYREVVRAPAARAPHTFRSLLDQQVIEILATDDESDDRTPARADRYRVRPFMIGAVIAHLRSRNILH